MPKAGRLRSTPVTSALLLALSLVGTARADVVWPALYVVASHHHFWYVIVAGFALEVLILRSQLGIATRRAILISFVANTFSATVGMLGLSLAMIGWHFAMDRIVDGTFAPLNLAASLILMLGASILLETALTRAIWKLPIRRTLRAFSAGNILSYTVVAIDLYCFGGWSRSL